MVAFGLESVFWEYLKPYVWFLFFPAVFVAAWFDGIRGGCVATVLSALLATYRFVPPYDTLRGKSPGAYFAVAMFAAIGVFVSWLQGRLRAEEERAARELLAASEDRYRRLFDSMLNGVAYCRLVEEGGRPVDFVFLAVNSAFFALTGFDDVLGRRITELIPGYREMQPEVLELYGRVVRSGEPERLETFVPGLGFWFGISAFRPAPGHFAVVFERIDERKRHGEMLERKVRERTAELQAANAELESFAYAVSHDLRAPLRAMNGFSQALLEDHARELSPGAKACLAEITTAGRKMGLLIDGLLRLSRSTRGELQRETVDLSARTRSILMQLAAREPERRVDWSVGPECTVRGDPTMLDVVLGNLLENAWKYTARTPHAVIRAGGERRGDAVEFTVSDNGAGFDARHAAKLFQPFQRLHRQDEFPGIGIGLATVQRIAHRHGGSVEAVSEPGAGATFRLRLPADAAPGTTPPA